MNFPNVGEEFESRYRLERVLGEGGFARVFEATETALGRRVAIKILKPQPTGYPAGIRARFEREIRVIANLTDPHTITVFDWGETRDGLLFMVMEFVGGQDLAELIHERGPLDEASTVRITRQLLASLREAHDHQLLHRDLKPHNIRVYEYAGDPLCVKLLDFGIAKPIEGGPQLTREGAVIGSPRYMAPEALLEQPLGPASDLYSLGLVMYEMLLGWDSRKGSHLFDQLERLKSGQAVQIPADAPISAEMRDLLERLLSPAPPGRYQRADEVLQVLDRMKLPGVAPPEREIPPRGPDILPNPIPAPPPRARPTLVEPPKDAAIGARHVLLAVVVLAAIVGVILVFAENPEPPAQVTAPSSSVRTHAVTETVSPRDVEPARSLTGCGLEPPFIGLGEMSTIDVLSEIRWGVYVPPGYHPDRRHSVLVFFPEDTDSAKRTMKLSGFGDFADERDVVIVLPLDPSIRAWRGMDQVRGAARVVELASESLCLDTDRLFAFGHGTGGRAAERIPCLLPVRAAATSSHRPEATEKFCQPSDSVAYLHIAPLNDGYDPISGRGSCGAEKISLDELESRWRDRNGCGEGTDVFAEHCVSYGGCESEFVMCRSPGGHRWPGQTSRRSDVGRCDNGSVNADISKIVWKFFDRYLGETENAP